MCFSSPQDRNLTPLSVGPVCSLLWPQCEATVIVRGIHHIVLEEKENMYLPPSQIPIPARNAESHGSYGASLVAQMVKNLPAMQETWV